MFFTTDGNGDDYILAGHDGGIQRFVGDADVDDLNSAANWEDLNGFGLNISELYNFDIIDEDYKIVTGHQDNHNFSLDVENNNWSNINSAGDGSDVHVDFQDQGRVIYQVNGCFKSTNVSSAIKYGIYGTNEGHVDCGQEFGYLTLSPIDQNRFENENFIVGFKNLYWSDDRGATFTNKTQFDLVNIAQPAITSLSYHPTNKNLVYFARNRVTYGNATLKDSILYKCSNISATNPTFVDLSQPTTDVADNDDLYQAFARSHVSEILTSPQNEVWLSFAGYNNDSENYKIFYSNNGGTSWYNHTYNLPVAPINCMQIDWRNKIMYVGTDFGVYYKYLYSGQWNCFSFGMSSSPVTSLKIDYCNGKIMASTFGRGMFQSDLVTNSQVLPFVSTINQNGGSITFNTDHTFVTDVRISGNTTVNLSGCTWKFTANAKLIVDAGSVLNVDDATLTSLCPNNMWQGVEVRSLNTYISQYDNSNGEPGKIIVKNDSYIENAKIGIAVGHKMHSSHNGGIASVNSTIKNCEIGIAFYKYSATFNGLTLNNRSRISTNNFVTTKDYLDFENSDHPKEFILVSEISGLNIEGNVFENQDPKKFIVDNRGVGIWSENSKLNVVGKCSGGAVYPPICNPASITPNMFKYLSYGVRASSTNSFNTARIDHAVFNSNNRGVYLINQQFSTVTNCSFDPYNFAVLGENGYTDIGNYGIYLHECTDYLITENDFSTAIGVYVYNLNPYPAKTELYKNYFNNPFAGIIAMKENRGVKIQNEYKKYFGHEFRCNTFDDTQFDVTVFDEPGISLTIGAPTPSNKNGKTKCG